MNKHYLTKSFMGYSNPYELNRDYILWLEDIQKEQTIDIVSVMNYKDATIVTYSISCM